MYDPMRSIQIIRWHFMRIVVHTAHKPKRNNQGSMCDKFRKSGRFLFFQAQSINNTSTKGLQSMKRSTATTNIESKKGTERETRNKRVAAKEAIRNEQHI